VSESTNRSIRSRHGAPQLVAAAGARWHHIASSCTRRAAGTDRVCLSSPPSPATSAINQSAPSIVRTLWHIARLSILTSMRQARNNGGGSKGWGPMNADIPLDFSALGYFLLTLVRGSVFPTFWSPLLQPKELTRSNDIKFRLERRLRLRLYLESWLASFLRLRNGSHGKCP